MSTAITKTGILLINLGTPDAPKTKEVRRYLREFLFDPRVIDIHPLGRWLLLNLIILPFRPKKSAHAYRQVWMDDGSPLLVYGKKLKSALSKTFETEGCPVELGMRYGNPSLKKSMNLLLEQGCNRIIAVPLYPQYASSTVGSVIEALYQETSQHWDIPQLQIIPPFYTEPSFIEAWKKVGEPFLKEQPDHILFSFHGLPLRHLEKSDASKNTCKNDQNCCTKLSTSNRNCYRAQCYNTAESIAQRFQLANKKWSVSFQSRLGRDEWIRPYTDEHLENLAKQGIKKLLVFCPAFVADGLETLEEIQIRAAEDFKNFGGEELILVPSLNDHPEWVKSLESMIRKQM